MKKYISFVLFLLFLYSCEINENSSRLYSDKKTTETDGKSKYYNEVILKYGGDFSGFNLGMDYKDALKIIPKNFIIEREKEYILYRIEKTFSLSEYELLFVKNELKEIYFDTEIKNETDEQDSNGSLELFKDLKVDFMKKYGEKYIESEEDDPKILFWNKDKVNVQLILEKSEVHAYFDIID